MPSLDPLLPLRALAWVLLLWAVRQDAARAVLPDRATLPALLLGLIAAFAGDPARIGAACTVAGGLVLIARLGALALRRGRDTPLRETPLSFDSVLLGCAVGALGGVAAGVAAGGLQALASTLAQALRRRVLRLPEPLMLALCAAAHVAAMGVAAGNGAAGNGAAPALAGLQAAGALALAGAFVARLPIATSTGEEPIALGFGDVKLAAALALLLPTGGLAAWLGLALLIALIEGALRWLLGRSTALPLGPALYLAAVATLLATGPAP